VTETLIVYHAHHSTCSQKVRICLAEKQLAWQPRLIDLGAKQQLEPDYLRINPNGVVPTLVHDGEAIVDSSVICEYLDEVFPKPALSPADPAARARMRAWMRYIEEVPTVAVRYPSFNMAFLNRYDGLDDKGFLDQQADVRPLRREFFRTMSRHGFDDSEIEAALENTRKTVERMAAALDNTAWLAGDSFSLADIVMAPLIDRMDDLGFAGIWADLGTVKDWFARIKARKSFGQAFYKGTRLSELHDLKPALKSKRLAGEAAS